MQTGVIGQMNGSGKRIYGFEITYLEKVDVLITDIKVVIKRDIELKDGSKGCEARTVDVRGLWDTGATRTTLCDRIPAENDLDVVSNRNVYSLQGKTTSKVYRVDIVLPNGVTVKDVRVGEADFDPYEFDVLIGMDVISRGKMTVDNTGDKTIFSFVMLN